MIHGTGERKPNDPKLRCGGPESALTEQGGARRRRGLCTVGGKVAGEAQPVTEPGRVTAASPKLTARPAVTCSAWLGVARLAFKEACVIDRPLKELLKEAGYSETEYEAPDTDTDTDYTRKCSSCGHVWTY